jgi:hypothetical protein
MEVCEDEGADALTVLAFILVGWDTHVPTGSTVDAVIEVVSVLEVVLSGII